MIGPMDADAGTGDTDVFVAKLDPTGKTLWSQAYGDTQPQTGAGAGADTAGNVYFAGAYAGMLNGLALPMSNGGQDAFVVMLDPTGKPVWQHAGGDAADQGVQALAVTPSGGVVVAGYNNGVFAFDGGGPMLGTTPGTTSVFVQRFDAGGNSIFGVSTASNGGASLAQQATAVAIDPNGDVIVVGSFAGNIIFPNAASAVSAGGNDIFVMKLDGMTGHVAWAGTYGGMGDDEPNSVAIDSKGDVLLGGYFTQQMTVGTQNLTTTGTLGMFVAHLSGNDGSVVWANAFGAGNLIDRMYVAVDSKDDLFVSGFFDGTLSLGSGAPSYDSGVPVGTLGAALFIGQLDPNGVYLHSSFFGMGGFAATLGSAVAPLTDTYVVAGATLEPIDLGSGTPLGTGMMVAQPLAAAYAP
jgi:hypothetical protein